MSGAFIVLSSIFALISPLTYVRAIVAGHARPHRTTRFVLLLITTLTTAALFAAGDRVAIWLAAISTLQSIVIFSLSIKYGMGGWSRADLACLTIALGGILLWQITQNPVLALYCAIAADFVGMIPTLVKTYFEPHTEVATFFALDVVAAFFSLCALSVWNVQDYSYPLYIMCINLCMVTLVIRGRLAVK